MPKKNIKSASINNVSSLIVKIAILSLYAFVAKYIIDLEKKQSCPCSNIKERTLLKNLILSYIFINVLFVILAITNLYSFLPLLQLISIILLIGIIVTFFKYDNKMNKANCECSENNGRTFFRFYAYFMLGLWILMLLFFVILLFTAKPLQTGKVVKVDLRNS